MASNSTGQNYFAEIGNLWTATYKLDIESTNNRAERAIRPVVIARKISGGRRPNNIRNPMASYTIVTSYVSGAEQ